MGERFDPLSRCSFLPHPGVQNSLRWSTKLRAASGSFRLQPGLKIPRAKLLEAPPLFRGPRVLGHPLVQWPGNYGMPTLPGALSQLLTGWPEPGLEQKMVYFRITPLGFEGGSQDTTTLLAEEGTALIPAGGPGTARGKKRHDSQGLPPALASLGGPHCSHVGREGAQLTAVPCWRGGTGRVLFFYPSCASHWQDNTLSL